MKMFYNLLSFFSMENFTEAFGEEIKMLTYNLTAYRSYNEEVKKENLSRLISRELCPFRMIKSRGPVFPSNGMINVNQILFATTLSHDLLETYSRLWQLIFVSKPCTDPCYYNYKGRFTVRNIHDDEALGNLANFSRFLIKFGLQ